MLSTTFSNKRTRRHFISDEKKVNQGLALAFVAALIAAGVVAHALYAENEKVPYRSSVQVPPDVSGTDRARRIDEGGQDRSEDQGGNKDQSEASDSSN